MDARRAGAGVMLLAAGALAACAPIPQEAASPPPPRSTPSPSATASVPPKAGAFMVWIPRDETILGEVTAMRGSAQFGPFENPTGRVAVYIRCLGEGEVVVEIVDGASMTQQCQTDSADPGTRNTFDVWATDEVVITGSAENRALWTAAVTAIPKS